jgi:hypothetical protein
LIRRRPHTDYVIHETAVAYWRRQKLPKAVVDRLRRGRSAFADPGAGQARLRRLAITQPRHVRIASEGALLGSLIAHRVSPELAILSDEAVQFDVLVHAACWIHAERPLSRMIPFSEEHRAAIERVRRAIWEPKWGVSRGIIPNKVQQLRQATLSLQLLGSVNVVGSFWDDALLRG